MKSTWFFIPVILLLFACNKEKRSNEAGLEMQNFVEQIASYAKQLHPGFQIIPQNGPELAFTNLQVEEGTNAAYLAAVDAFGMEEVFYNGDLAVDNDRLNLLRQLKLQKKIMVADFASTVAGEQDAIQRNLQEGFICFPRNSSNYDYQQIPDSAIRSNTRDITTMADASNYLYLIDQSNFSSKQDLLSKVAATDFDVVIMDLFFGDEAYTASELQQLKTKAHGGKRLLISYINIGAAEKYRYYWKKTWFRHHPLWIKKRYEGYPDEYWVNYWNKDWQAIIYGNDDSYVKKIIDAGFDGAYLDNVEAYYFLYYKD